MQEEKEGESIHSHQLLTSRLREHCKAMEEMEFKGRAEEVMDAFITTVPRRLVDNC